MLPRFDSRLPRVTTVWLYLTCTFTLLNLFIVYKQVKFCHVIYKMWQEFPKTDDYFNRIRFFIEKVSRQ